MDFRIITVTELDTIGCWLPDLFCEKAGRVAQLASHSRRLGDVAWALEGWRVTPDTDSRLNDSKAKEAPRYRQANIGFFVLNIEASHCTRPIFEDQAYCVQPGDVIIPRILPLRASRVAERNHRHPIDGNCFLVRGLKSADSAWLLALLNEVEYEEYFVTRSGSQTLPRIGLRELRGCPFPNAPAGITIWAGRLNAWVEQFTENAIRLFDLQSDVAQVVAKSVADAERPMRRLCPGVKEPAKLLSVDSWLPGHVESEYRQQALFEHGWLRLAELLTPASCSPARLKSGEKSSFQLLSLKDVSGVFLPSVEPSDLETRIGRFFAEPVHTGEVLVSSLVTSLKVAYADSTLAEKIHPIDHWLRLAFRETPGAWALVLSTPAVGTQFQKLAMGSAQQFTTASRLMDLHMPSISRAQRERWQSRLDEILGDRRRLDAEWKDLRLEGRRMVAEALDIPWSEMQKRSLK